jgi:hypothetical protein
VTQSSPTARRLFSPALLLCAFAGVIALTAAACGDDTLDGAGTAGATGSASSGGGATAGSGGAGGATSGAGGGGAPSSSSSGIGPPPTEIAECQGKTYDCGDLVDNDMDGLLDSQDPDCLGPCDNTEAGYYGGIPGQSGPACVVDCYFDQDSGAGNDDCHWNHQCDPYSVAPSYYPEPESGAQCEYDPNANTSGTSATCAELLAAQSQTCLDLCLPLTPNGCDCFGCCELPAGTGKFVWLGSENPKDVGSCDEAGVNDPDKCHPCTPVPGCYNDCGKCEVCIGKPIVDPDCLPPSSSSSSGSGGGGQGGNGSGGGDSQQCPDGVQPCGQLGQDPCSIDYYCVTGCCQKVPT